MKVLFLLLRSLIISCQLGLFNVLVRCSILCYRLPLWWKPIFFLDIILLFILVLINGSNFLFLFFKFSWLSSFMLFNARFSTFFRIYLYFFYIFARLLQRIYCSLLRKQSSIVDPARYKVMFHVLSRDQLTPNGLTIDSLDVVKAIEAMQISQKHQLVELILCVYLLVKSDNLDSSRRDCLMQRDLFRFVDIVKRN